MTGSHRALHLRRIFLPILACIAAFAAAGPANAGTPWTMGGQNIGNTRSTTSTITSESVGNLAVKWTFTTSGDVSATPAVVDNAVYFPSWGQYIQGFALSGGYLYKLNAKTGALIWSHKISDYTGIANSVSRTSPVVVGNTVYIGDQNGAHLMAVNATTGSLKWITTLGTRTDHVITQSPVIFGNTIYVGVTSLEEGNVAFIPNAPCCSARGYFNAVNASTGQILWQTYMTPPGYSGAGVWGSTPTIDPSTQTVYLTTGNNYSIPASAKACEANGGTPEQCLDPTNHYDAIVALNMLTGEVRWANHLEGYDDWNVACIFPFFNPLACPQNAGPDYDFGSGPNLFTIQDRGQPRKVVGAGQKSGQYWLLDAVTGAVLWVAHPGPGSTLGGIEWGTATDGQKIYVTETNYFHIPYQLADGSTSRSGSFAALDAKTGAVVWQIEDPGAGTDPFHAVPLGPPTVANGVVYVGSMTSDMYALDANNGSVLWKYDGAGPSNAGPAVSDGTVYWGNGYNHLGIPEGAPSTTFYAFSVNGN